MTRDIDYFDEKSLSDTNLWNFYISLPSHLQCLFKESLHAKITIGNTLQGYKGPASHCNGGSGEVVNSAWGVQTIKFWWGASATINFLPIAGSIAFGLSRWLQSAKGHLEWSTMYFDEVSGKAMSESNATQIKQKNKEAENANDKGLTFCKEGKFREAYEWFSKAYQTCSGGYEKERGYKINRDATKIALDAQHHLSNQEFPEAVKRFEEAYTVSTNSEISSIFSRYRDSAKESGNKAADYFYNQAKNLFEQGKYSEAKILFNKAAHACSLDIYNKSTFLKNVAITEYCMEANNLYKISNEQGKDRRIHENNDNFNETKNRNGEAHNIVSNNEGYTLLNKIANLEIEGSEFYNEGLLIQNRSSELRQPKLLHDTKTKYQEARDKYNEAKCHLQQEFNISGNKDFVDCVEFIRKFGEEITMLLQTIERHTIT